jgi:hypothetical protein
MKDQKYFSAHEKEAFKQQQQDSKVRITFAILRILGRVLQNDKNTPVRDLCY